MSYAYNKMYLDDAMRNLGEAFDYAANDSGMDLDFFLDMFIAGGLAKQFGAGVPKYVAGMSGVELVYEVVDRSGMQCSFPEIRVEYERSPEYWCGWILSYYQWKTGRSFKNIRQYISMEEIRKLYATLHEASEEKFVDTVNKIISRKEEVTRLQRLRRMIGYSQRVLAEKSGVSLRMIQQYEQRAKDINRATGKNLLALSKTLGCTVEELMEYNIEETDDDETD